MRKTGEPGRARSILLLLATAVGSDVSLEDALVARGRARACAWIARRSSDILQGHVDLRGCGVEAIGSGRGWGRRQVQPGG